MATNELLPFANGEDANVLPTAQWQALTDILENGFQSGIARSEQVNRVLAQGAVASYVLGQLIVDQLNKNATLDKDTLYQNLVSALQENAKDACLPLSGGTMTGSITLKRGDDGIVAPTDDKYIEFEGGTAFGKGGSLVLYGKDNPDNTGMFKLYAHDGTMSYQLIGKPDGTLAWGGKWVERVEASGGNYIRFASGLQICWSTISNGSWTFPQAFVSAPIVLVTPRGDGAYHGTRVSSTNNTSCAVANGGGWGMNAIAIGHWK